MSKKNRKPAEPEQLAWAAGFIDGEGCITIVKQRKTYYQLVMVVANTNRKALMLLRNLFRFGQIYGRRPHSPNHLTCYSWRLSGWHAYEVIKEVLPYLIVKKREAEIAVRFYDLPAWGHPDKPRDQEKFFNLIRQGRAEARKRLD